MYSWTLEIQQQGIGGCVYRGTISLALEIPRKEWEAGTPWLFSFFYHGRADSMRKLADSLDTNGVSGVEVRFEEGSPSGKGHDTTVKILFGVDSRREVRSHYRELFASHVRVRLNFSRFIS